MEGSTSGQNRKLEWNWRYFITWLRVISLYPLSNVSNVIALTIRFALWTINLVAHVAQLFLFYKLGYETASPTEYWNAVIDYWNWTVHNILIHCLIIFVSLRKNHWMQLIQLLIKNDSTMQRYESKTSLKLKNRSILGLFYIAVAVRNYFTIEKKFRI